MKTKLLFCIAIIALIFTSSTTYCGDGTKDNPFKILWFGNSNTYMWGWYPNGVDMAADPALPKQVKEMALKADIPVYIDYEFQMGGGKNLQWHWENGGQDKITNGDFDYVVFNDHSTATFAYPTDFVNYSTLFSNLTKANGGIPIFFMGWPDDDQWNLRRDTIINSYDRLGVDLSVEIAPCGRAWEIIEEVAPNLDLFQDDDHHPNEYGVYMNTCVMYSMITNTPPAETNYFYSPHWIKPTPEEYRVMQDAAWKACMERLDVVDEINLSSSIENDRDIKLDWTNTESSTTALYGVYRNTELMTITDQTTYTINTVKPEAYHGISIIGFDVDTIALYNSNGIQLKLDDIDAPTIPDGIKVFKKGTDYAALSWKECTDNDAVKEYIVYVDGIKDGTTDFAAHQINGLQDGNTYNIEIVAVDMAGNESAKSAVFTLAFGDVTAIETNQTTFKLFPNPASNEVTVFSETGATITITNLSGSIVLREIATSENTRLNISDLSSGSYIVSLQQNLLNKSTLLVIN